MAKKRLGVKHREILENLAEKKVKLSEDSKAMDTAFKKMKDRVMEIRDEQWPLEEMHILKKYDYVCYKERSYIQFYLPKKCKKEFSYVNEFSSIEINEDEKRPTPDSRRLEISESDIFAELYNEYEKAKKEYKERIKSRLSDYRSLIYNSKSYEDVLDVWKEAEEVREQICGASKALTTINNDVILRIKNDEKKRNEKLNK